MWFKSDIIEAEQNQRPRKIAFISVILVLILSVSGIMFLINNKSEASKKSAEAAIEQAAENDKESNKDKHSSSLQLQYQTNENSSSEEEEDSLSKEEENTRIALAEINRVIFNKGNTSVNSDGEQAQGDDINQSPESQGNQSNSGSGSDVNNGSSDSNNGSSNGNNNGNQENQDMVDIPDIEAKINSMLQKVKVYVDWSLVPSEKNVYSEPLKLMLQRLKEGQPQTSFLGIMTNGEMYQIYLNDMYGVVMSNIDKEQFEIVTPYPEDAKSNLLYNIVLRDIYLKDDIKISSLELGNTKEFEFGDQKIKSFVKCYTNYGNIYLDINLNILDIEVV